MCSDILSPFHYLCLISLKKLLLCIVINLLDILLPFLLCILNVIKETVPPTSYEKLLLRALKLNQKV
jgi:hypothetical protein